MLVSIFLLTFTTHCSMYSFNFGILRTLKYSKPPNQVIDPHHCFKLLECLVSTDFENTSCVNNRIVIWDANLESWEHSALSPNPPMIKSGMPIVIQDPKVTVLESPQFRKLGKKGCDVLPLTTPNTDASLCTQIFACKEYIRNYM